MEGHGPDILSRLAQKVRQPLPDFVCRLVGEGDGKDRPGQSRLHGAQAVRPAAFRLPGFLSKAFQKSNVFFCEFLWNFIGIAAPTKAHEVRDPVDKHRGFAAARAGKQQQRPLRGHHRPTLFLVQLAELIFNILAACR